MEKDNKALKKLMQLVDNDTRIPSSDFSWTANVMEKISAQKRLNVKPLRLPLGWILGLSACFVSLVSIYFWNMESQYSPMSLNLPDFLPNLGIVYASLGTLALFIGLIFYLQIKKLSAKN